MFTSGMRLHTEPLASEPPESGGHPVEVVRHTGDQASQHQSIVASDRLYLTHPYTTYGPPASTPLKVQEATSHAKKNHLGLT